ncbi:MAG: recombinase family protein [Clostridiales Family XIII bacterium]|jgi:DNA invertase Pin-like site-specific DNA recombinase|nr:recombinase family protein [Clostridiales Family XIII bacterium]
MPKNKIIDTPPEISVIYGRYSSHAQKDVSIEQQVAECMEYAKSHNMVVTEVYADRALTGKNDRRPEFQKMIRHAEKRKFAVIIAYKSNRIGRNMLQALAYEEKLSKFGVRIVYAKEEFGDNAAGRFALRTMMNVNQFYSENMAEDIKRGLRNNAENCIVTGSLPLGYKKGEDGKYAIDEPNAEIVKEIFNRVANDESFADIANDLNARTVKTSKRAKWNKNSFRKMLENERYTGVYIYEDIRIEGGVPQIIEKGVFYRVQETVKNKAAARGRHRENGDYLLTGKLYCGKCKSPMTGESGTSRDGSTHYYYACRKKRVEKACDKMPVRRDFIEREVADAIRNYVLRDDVIEWIANMVVEYAKTYKDKTDIPRLESELANTKRAINNIVSAIEQGVFTSATKDRLLALEADQAAISMRLTLERADILEVSKDDVISGLESLRDGDVNDEKYKAHLFKTFLTAVYLYDDELKIAFSFTDKKQTMALHIDMDNVEKEANPGCSFKFLSPAPSISCEQGCSPYSPLNHLPFVAMRLEQLHCSKAR